MRVLCVIQARYASTRLPGKMLFPIGGASLIARAHAHACRIFDPQDVVIATPDHDAALFRAFVPRAAVFGYMGPENDVLGRLFTCAHSVLNWAQVTHVARWTPDDWRKDTRMVQEAAFEGIIHPAAQSIELFSAGQLISMQSYIAWDAPEREHIGLLHPAKELTPPHDGLPWSIDTRKEYLAVAALHTRS